MAERRGYAPADGESAMPLLVRLQRVDLRSSASTAAAWSSRRGGISWRLHLQMRRVRRWTASNL